MCEHKWDLGNEKFQETHKCGQCIQQDVASLFVLFEEFQTASNEMDA